MPKLLMAKLSMFDSSETTNDSRKVYKNSKLYFFRVIVLATQQTIKYPDKINKHK